MPDTEFNDKQLKYLADTDFLLEKSKITNQIIQLLAKTEAGLREAVEALDFRFPNQVLIKSGKISKGEQYLGLPYAVLDYPRCFISENTFAYRTMFWWGHFFSNTLHLDGQMLALYRQSLVKNIDTIKSLDNLFVCVNETPWEYHYEPSNYLKTNTFSQPDLTELISNKPFLKFSFQYPIDHWQELKRRTCDNLITLVELLR
ncbi:MAG: hypothetical protein AAFX87_05170 [Bacteroidota bacterium]